MTNRHIFQAAGLSGAQSGELAKQIDRYDDRPNLRRMLDAGFELELAEVIITQIRTGVANPENLVLAGASGRLAEVLSRTLGWRP